jgi:endonuclease YncB( thermonuclease family)
LLNEELSIMTASSDGIDRCPAVTTGGTRSRYGVVLVANGAAAAPGKSCLEDHVHGCLLVRSR